MQSTQLAETIQFQTECFWILQEVWHELFEEKNEDAVRLFNHIYSRRPNIDWREVPFFQIKTALAMLILPVCYLSTLNDDALNAAGGLRVREYNITYKKNNQVTQPSPTEFLRTVRNALAHLPDFAAGRCRPNISFDDCILRLYSANNSSEVVFQEGKGFIIFVEDIIRTARRATQALINPQSAPQDELPG